MNFKNLMMTAVLGSATLASCSSFDPAQTAKEWEVLKIGNEQLVPGPTTPYIGFEKDQIYGYTGCNRINGGIEIKGKNIQAKQIATTMRLCPNAQYEQPFLKALNEAENIRECAEGFELTDAAGSVVLTFAPRTLDLEALAGQWNLVSLNGEAIQPGEEMPFIIFDINEKRFSGFTGCNRLSATLNLDELKQCKAKFDNVAMTRKLCENHKMESDFVEVLNDATTIRIAEGQLYIYSENSDLTLVFAKQQ